MNPRSHLVLTLAIFVFTSQIVLAGDLNPPANPDSPDSAMFTLEDLYQRLAVGSAGIKRGPGFVEPLSGPSGTGRTLDEVMSVAPRSDNASGGSPADVLAGRRYWSLRSDGPWGGQTGTMPNVGQQNLTPGTAPQPISQGFHDGTGSVAGDGNLVSGNIRGGVDLFGVIGDPNVVNTSSGDATAADLVLGKKAWVDGVELTGTATPDSAEAGSLSANLGMYDNRIANFSPRNAYTEVCIKNGTVLHDVHLTGDESTAGGNCLPSDVGWIIERDERETTESWDMAKMLCLLDGMRLPEIFEYKYSCNNAGLFQLADMTGNAEWTSNSGEQVGPGNGAIRAGQGVSITGQVNCAWGAIGLITSNDAFEEIYHFRCAR